MKKYLLLFLLFTSCIKIENNIPNNNNMNGFVEITICNDYNNTAYVVSDNDTIAVVSSKTTIIVPKNYNYDITYCDCSSENYNKYNQLLCFEDLLKGDFDYNDLILYVSTKQYYKKNKIYKVSIDIEPIALGSSNNIEFGLDLPDNRTVIISDNCRIDFFNNDNGFINTVKGSKFINYPKKRYVYDVDNAESNCYIKPFIISSNHKSYVAAYNENNSISFNGYPYGLAITDRKFKYPQETINITKCYPNFLSWVYGNSTNFTDNYNNEYLY